MAWQTPKTNWQAADVVSKDDFNRIEGNIQHLQDTKETPAGAQAKADGAEARAKAYTDQEVAEVSQALDAHKAANIVVHGVARGTSTFAGQGQERAIAHGLGATPKAAYATPTEDPQGRLGEVWIRMTSTHLYVGNSGSFTGGMSWVAIL